MGTNTPKVTVSTTTSASDLHDKIDTLEDFVNYGIDTSYEIQGPGNPISTEPWVETNHIWAPDFYGAPAPRTELVSSQVHYRRTLNDIINEGAHFSAAHSAKSWQYIPGLTASVKLMRDCIVDVTASWFAFEYGGITGVETTFEKKEACKFRLAVNDTGYSSTTRYLRTSCGLNTHITRKQFSVVKQLELAAGVHNIGIRLYLAERVFHNPPLVPAYNKKVDQIKFVFVGGRNIVIDAHEKKNLDDAITREAKVGEPSEKDAYGDAELVEDNAGQKTSTETY